MEFQRAKRSPIWEHFERQDGKAKCKLCSNMYAYHGGTTNLREHLKRCHPETQAKEKESKESAVSTSAGTRRIDSFAVSTAVKKCSIRSQPSACPRAFSGLLLFFLLELFSLSRPALFWLTHQIMSFGMAIHYGEEA